jgi:hypothetical protein
MAAAIVCAISVPALAQRLNEPTVPAQPQAPKLDPKACSDRDRLKRGDTVETEGHAPRPDEPITDRLARTDSVICPPPGLDPNIRAPAPHTGSDMPVIAPEELPPGPQAPAN